MIVAVLAAMVVVFVELFLALRMGRHFGATSATQLRQNVTAVETHAALDADARTAIAALAA